MELNQSEVVVAQPTSVNSDFSADETYTFVFQNNEQEEVRTIAANVLQRYPNCMLTRMVNSLVSTRRTADGGYIVKDRNLEMVDYIINFMQNPNEFQLLPSFKKHDNLIPEADFYCLQDLKDLLEMEVKKNAMTITFCTQHTPSSKVLCLSQDTLRFYELYMNTEEKEAFLSNTLNMRQVIRMKMQLQKDGFSCLSSYTKFNENGFDMEVILTETFKRK